MKREEVLIKLFSKAESSILMNSDLFNYLEQNGFYEQVASTRFHGDYKGGLFDHSLEVTNKLLELTEKLNLQWSRPESPYIVGMFHDLCKIDEYEVRVTKEGKTMFGEEDVVGEEIEIEKVSNNPIQGHGDKSIIYLSQFLTLTEEEILCIRYHMGAYETGSWNEYDQAIKKYETVLWTHTANMYASKVKNT